MVPAALKILSQYTDHLQAAHLARICPYLTGASRLNTASSRIVVPGSVGPEILLKWHGLLKGNPVMVQFRKGTHGARRFQDTRRPRA